MSPLPSGIPARGITRGDIFDVDRYPWIHLRLDEEALLRLSAEGALKYARHGDDVGAEIKYMMSSDQLNRRPARDYVRICSGLKDLLIDRNDLDLEPESVLEAVPQDARAELVARAGGTTEPLALTHTLAAWKVRRPSHGRFVRKQRQLRRRLGARAKAVVEAVAPAGREGFRGRRGR